MIEMSDKESEKDLPEDLTKALRNAFESKIGEAIPDFDATWSAAESRMLASKRRNRITTGVAASIALFAIIFSLQLQQQSPDLSDFKLDSALMASTQWVAPSDVLMSEQMIDFYPELPELIPSTDFTEGLIL